MQPFVSKIINGKAIGLTNMSDDEIMNPGVYKYGGDGVMLPDPAPRPIDQIDKQDVNISEQLDEQILEILEKYILAEDRADDSNDFEASTKAKIWAKQAIKSLVTKARIDELNDFMDAITDNEAERELRGEDCIESNKWQRLYNMCKFRTNELTKEDSKKDEA